MLNTRNFLLVLLCILSVIIFTIGPVNIAIILFNLSDYIYLVLGLIELIISIYIEIRFLQFIIKKLTN
jgi:hypothetical protein